MVILTCPRSTSMVTTLAGIWTPVAEFAFHIEYHYTTNSDSTIVNQLLPVMTYNSSLANLKSHDTAKQAVNHSTMSCIVFQLEMENFALITWFCEFSTTSLFSTTILNYLPQSTKRQNFGESKRKRKADKSLIIISNSLNSTLRVVI